MKRVYHSNASTNIRLREEISKSKLPNYVLTLKYVISAKTMLVTAHVAQRNVAVPRQLSYAANFF